MYCTNCGATVGADDAFCGSCGASVTATSLPQTPIRSAQQPASAHERQTSPAVATQELVDTRRRVSQERPSRESPIDALEMQLLIEKAKVKSPGFAAILGFFFPAIAAFYTRRIGAGIFYLIVDFFNLILVVIGVGVITGLLFRLIAAYLAYTWAREINQKALAQLAESRKQSAV